MKINYRFLRWFHHWHLSDEPLDFEEWVKREGRR